MTYTRPPGVKYTDMAIYVDKNVYQPVKDENKIYEYIYHLCYMLACKHRYFKKFNEYDEFALFAATKIYLRMTNKRQFEVNEGEKKLEPIKSVLNYIKLALYGIKVDFQKIVYGCVLNPETDKIDTDTMKENMLTSIQCDYRNGMDEEIETVISKLPQTINKVLSKTPYKIGSLQHKNIKISCLLTLLNNVTLSEKSKLKVEKKEETEVDCENLKQKLYDSERNYDVILWHLDPSISPYIQALCKKINKKFSYNIKEIIKAYTLPEEELEAILMSNYEQIRREYEIND